MKTITLKEFQALLKNGDRYIDGIKFARGVLLENALTTPMDKNISMGISTEKYGKNWYMLPKGKAIFKTFDCEWKEIKDLRIINELLCYELSKQVGILCAEYELASLNGEMGVVTYDIRKKDEQLLTSFEWVEKSGTERFDNSISNYVNLARQFQKDGYKIDIDKMILSLYKIMLFDALTDQTDRHMGNIFFLVNEKEKTMKVSPLIDNELAFNIMNFASTMLSDYKVTPLEFENQLGGIYQQLIISEKKWGFEDIYFTGIKQLVDLAKLNKDMNKILKTFYQNYDMQKAIDAVKAKGVVISKKYEEYLLTSELVSKDLIGREYKNKNRETTKSGYENVLKEGTCYDV